MELQNLQQMLQSLEVCANYLTDAFAGKDQHDWVEACKRFSWVQQRMSELQENIAHHMEDTLSGIR